MKSLVIGRKNWLFSTSTDDARANAIWMTILETAKANVWIRVVTSKRYWKTSHNSQNSEKVEELEAYLPWNLRQSESQAVSA